MKLFSGFPAGKVEVTPLPNLFFSELAPAIDDLAEMKVTLHVCWLLAHTKSPYLRLSDLRADRVLIQSLKSAGSKPEERLLDGLTRATERGTLLYLGLEGDAVYFLNTEKGRRAFEEMQSVQDLPAQAPDPAGLAERPNIFALYEKNIGLLTPMIAEELKEAERQYSPEWIADALKIAVDNNKRNWSYARKILERWQTEGRADKGKKKKPWYGDEYSKFVKR